MIENILPILFCNFKLQNMGRIKTSKYMYRFLLISNFKLLL